MVGAFNAGADAVYLGGSKFGARAYADNFDKDQVLDAISYAHLHGKRIYMTVNTLVKEREFDQLYDFLAPFAEKHLDGVIVQDYGVMRFIRDEFPLVELHASTQQTITGVYGAKLLKDLGCCRVVPARELSLTEMKAIRKEADIEVEAFIHGAMCYCYSGACLFSSVVGGRSGNRGRCAQPCRLPYRLAETSLVKDKEIYPLSLKDMCTIDMIPELIEAGIDSFKIEGRMKRPEYAAGVTALYRKYIDSYYQNPSEKIRVSEEDMNVLKTLYLRTGISEGYYHKHNGKDMVTVSSPAYNGTSEEVLETIKGKYLTGELKVKCSIECRLVLGEPAVISMIVDKGEDGYFYEVVTGNEVQASTKRPMDEESVRKQLLRLGNTAFEAENIDITIDPRDKEGIFVPVSELNELRRQLCENMIQQLLAVSEAPAKESDSGADKASKGNHDSYDREMEADLDYHVLVNTAEQLDVAIDMEPSRIYVDSDIYFTLDKDRLSRMRELKNDEENGMEFIVALPFVTRRESFDATKDLEMILENSKYDIFDGVLIRNFEQLGFFKEKDYSGKVILDYGVYTWNTQAAILLSECNVNGNFRIEEMSVPLELSSHEIKELLKGISGNLGVPMSMNVYGKTPMMISAGCVKKTLQNCSGKMGHFNKETMKIVDRLGNELDVTTNCRNCYNCIWNVHPTSLHKKLDEIKNVSGIRHLRLDFTTEDKKETARILKGFMLEDKKALSEIDEMKYTTGHFKRAVE